MDGGGGSSDSQIALDQASITIENPIEANTDYTIPLNYTVGSEDLEVFYCGNKIQKDVDYTEVGNVGTISNKIQFKTAIGDIDMSGISGFENFKETLQFAVTGKTALGQIERIENENGTAIKFPDGTMICTYRETVTDQAINNTYGDIFTGIRNWIFPVQFIEKPIVSCDMFKWGTSASWAGVSGIGNTSASLVGYDIFSRETGTNVNISAIAIGRWK